MHINKQNLRFWDQAHPHQHTIAHLVRRKWLFGVPLEKNGISGLYLFEDKKENRMTVDTETYHALMLTEVIPALRRKRRVNVNTII